MTRLRHLSHTLLFSLTLAFVPVCYVAGVGVSDDSTFAGDELRSRHTLQLSGVSSAQLKAFFGAIEPYVADRLPFRPVLLSAQAFVHRRFGRLLHRHPEQLQFH